LSSIKHHLSFSTFSILPGTQVTSFIISGIFFGSIQNAIKTAESKVQTVKTAEDVKTATEELSKAIEEFNSSADKKEVDKTSLVNKIAEAKAIKQNKKTDEAFEKLQNMSPDEMKALELLKSINSYDNAFFKYDYRYRRGYY